MRSGKHDLQVHARKMLEAWCVSVPEGGDILSNYQSIVLSMPMERVEHNFQEHARMMLK